MSTISRCAPPSRLYSPIYGVIRGDYHRHEKNFIWSYSRIGIELMSNGRKWIVAGAERICEQPISESECKWILSSKKVVLKLQHYSAMDV